MSALVLGIVLLESGIMGILRLPELFSGGGGVGGGGGGGCGGNGMVKKVGRIGWTNAEWRKSDLQQNMCVHP